MQSRHWAIPIFAVCALAFLGLNGTATGQEQASRPARPGEKNCPIPLVQNAPGPWTKQEIWAWDARICLGEVADLSKQPESDDNSCDISKAEDWPADRDVSSRFVQTVLFHAPFKSAYARRGFRISCARFPASGEPKPISLDLNLGYFAHGISLYDSYFPARMMALHLHVGRNLSLQGSRFDGKVDADNLKVGGLSF